MSTGEFHYRFSVIPAGAITDQRIKARDLQVLCLLGRHTNRAGWCRRSQVKMAEELHCSRGTVQGSLDRLAEAGWVEVRLEGRGSVGPAPEKQPFAAHSYRVRLDVDVDAIALDQDDTADEVRAAIEGANMLAPPGAEPEKLAPRANPELAPLEQTLPKEESPQSPPCDKSKEREPVNFQAFFGGYPDHQVMSREKALEEFVALSQAERRAAITAVEFYSAQIARMRRKPIDAHRWLKERRFTQYGAGSTTTAGTRVYVPEGTEAWNAWCNFAAVAFGGNPKIPYYWAAQSGGGAMTPAAWPLGGQGWLVPFERWVFVEQFTPQYNRWHERVHEILNRSPLLVTAKTNYFDKRLIARDNAKWGERPIVGLVVPSEWPPRKTPENNLAKTG